MNVKTITQRLVSIQKLAEILGVSTRTVQRMKLAGVIHPYQITPTCPRYDADEVLAQMRTRRDAERER